MAVELFLDTPDLKEYQRHRHVLSGGTTNPSLMSRMGIAPAQYQEHSKKILDVLGNGVLSVEVTEVIPSRMYEEAMKFSKWDKRIAVKIPCPFYIDEAVAQRVHGEPLEKEIASSPLNAAVVRKDGKLYVDTLAVIDAVAGQGVPLNITAGFAYEQAHDVGVTIMAASKRTSAPAKTNYFSIFWGRILDRYVADKSLGISQQYNEADLNKIVEWSQEEVLQTARQLEGTNLRVILGSCRLPKVWEEAAKKEGEEKLRLLRREAYRAVLKVAQPVNGIPTVPPALIDAGRFNLSTADAVKGFVDDFLKLKESK